MFKRAIPVFHVTSSLAAETFYGDGLGCHRDFAYRPSNGSSEPGYIGFSRDGVMIHVSSFPGDGVAGGIVNISVDDVDEFYAELIARGVPIDLPPTNQTWGAREMHVKDADGNCIRFVRGVPG